MTRTPRLHLVARRRPLSGRITALFVLGVTAMVLIPTPARAADTFVFTPVADTYVDSSIPTTPKGSATSMWVDLSSPAKESFLRFNVQGISGRTVTKVTLRMYQTDDSPQGGSVYSMTDTAWTESGVTWNTKPAIDGALRGSFGNVDPNKWYELSLGVPFTGNGLVSFGIKSTNTDGARWRSRESATQPELVVEVASVPGMVIDGLSQVANANLGSSDPTYYASSHHVALTELGRTLVVYGKHAIGVQLAWRDPAGGWQTKTTGSVTGGTLLSGTSSGDWPASIVIADDSGGVQRAWVVWAGPAFSNLKSLQMRRLSSLDSSSGPTVGPIVTVQAAGSWGQARPDIGMEQIPGGSRRGLIVWTRRVGSSTWELVTKWFTNLGTDAPTFTSEKVLISGTSDKRTGTVVPTAQGIRVVAKGANGKLMVYGHDVAATLTTWWTGVPGIQLAVDAKPSAAALSTGEIVAVGESNVTMHTVTVQKFANNGSTVTTLGSWDGYTQPSIATNGTNVYVVMVRMSDGYVVSKTLSGGVWSADRVEIGAEGGGNHKWPNTVRQTDGRLRFVVRGPNGTTAIKSAVLAFQRIL